MPCCGRQPFLHLHHEIPDRRNISLRPEQRVRPRLRLRGIPAGPGLRGQPGARPGWPGGRGAVGFRLVGADEAGPGRLGGAHRGADHLPCPRRPRRPVDVGPSTAHEHVCCACMGDTAPNGTSATRRHVHICSGAWDTRLTDEIATCCGGTSRPRASITGPAERAVLAYASVTCGVHGS